MRLNNHTADPPYKEINQCLWSKFLDMSSLLGKAELGTGKLHSNLALLHYARNTVWFGLEVGHLHKSLSAAQKLKLTANVPHLSIGTSWLTTAFPKSH